MIRKLPSWEQSEASVNDQAASPLETFIHEFEPAGEDAGEFRKDLAAVLNDSKAYLQAFVRNWSPDSDSDAREFHDKLGPVLDWRKAFASGCPDTAWES